MNEPFVCIYVRACVFCLSVCVYKCMCARTYVSVLRARVCVLCAHRVAHVQTDGRRGGPTLVYTCVTRRAVVATTADGFDLFVSRCFPPPSREKKLLYDSRPSSSSLRTTRVNRMEKSLEYTLTLLSPSSPSPEVMSSRWRARVLFLRTFFISLFCASRRWPAG